MTPEDFTLWLQGFAELNDTPPTPAQWQSIKEHLALCFEKVTPPVARSDEAETIRSLRGIIRRRVEKREREKNGEGPWSVRFEEPQPVKIRSTC